MLIAAQDPRFQRQARFTFALLRHLLVDVTTYMQIEPHAPHEPRVEHGGFEVISGQLTELGIQIGDREAFAPALREILDSYEALANGVGEWLLTPMPSLLPTVEMHEDDWQAGA